MSVFDRMLNGSSDTEDLLACVFRLSELESRTYFSLLETPGARIDELARVLDRDRSTAHRAVQRLVDLRLAERDQTPLEGGGYCYRYRAADPSTVRAMIEERVDAFEQAVRDRLERFEETAPAPAGEAVERP